MDRKRIKIVAFVVTMTAALLALAVQGLFVADVGRLPASAWEALRWLVGAG